MIGFYNYTVILTYLGLISGSTGIFFAMQGGTFNTFIAIVCLLTAGFLDLFDGKVARTKKDRTQDEKNFGIQIDSLSDIVCFGVLPAAIGYAVVNNAGLNPLYFIPLFAGYILCGLIRLAFFNVKELNEFYGTVDHVEKVYYGMPITMASLILPAFYCARPWMTNKYFYLLYTPLLGLLAILFILKVKFPKPNKVAIIAMALLGTALTIASIVLNIVFPD